jgi:hypothetical protein
MSKILASLVGAAYAAAAPITVNLSYHKEIPNIETMSLHYHQPFYATGEFLIGVENPRYVDMTIDTGSSWVWAYSQYAINKPEGIKGIPPREVKIGAHKTNLSYGMGGLLGYVQEEDICFAQNMCANDFKMMVAVM